MWRKCPEIIERFTWNVARLHVFVKDILFLSFIFGIFRFSTNSQVAYLHDSHLFISSFLIRPSSGFIFDPIKVTLERESRGFFYKVGHIHVRVWRLGSLWEIEKYGEDSIPNFSHLSNKVCKKFQHYAKAF